MDPILMWRQCHDDQDTNPLDRIGRASEEGREALRGQRGVDRVDVDPEFGAGVAEPSRERERAVADEEQVLNLDAACSECLQATEEAPQM